MINIILQPYELYTASQLGLLRAYNSIKSVDVVNQKHWCGNLSAHVTGVLGEMAVAKAFSTYYSGTVNTWKTLPDVLANGAALEVRTRSSHDWDLIVRKEDNGNSIYIHVTGNGPDMQVHGWLFGHTAKQDKWLQPYGGKKESYFVPAENLFPIEDLIKLVNQKGITNGL